MFTLATNTFRRSEDRRTALVYKHYHPGGGPTHCRGWDSVNFHVLVTPCQRGLPIQSCPDALTRAMMAVVSRNQPGNRE